MLAIKKPRFSAWGIHFVLLAYAAIALGPILLIVFNSLKSRRALFDSAFSVPTPGTFDLVGYRTVFEQANFERYFLNSFIVTVASVLLVVLLSAMAAHALVEYKFPGNTFLTIYMAIGIMIPIRLGTVSLLDFIVDLKLVNTLWALILVYTAMGIPLGIFLLSQFFRQVPGDIKAAARIDGANEYRIFGLVIPLVRPGLGAVAVFTMLPVWNDLWFPLILAPEESKRTVTLGAQQFLGQFASDWNAVLAALTLAMVPVLILYVIFSRQFLRGLTEGAVK
ncbi:MAG: carbohydrate ABC transporter permease [Acidimicrobiia bacterium]|nr:carbohydrate ABC transporter permease [Acidimicrobiia bacterium]MYC58354.1 carbohydrate ABC transporter permease [Acidimicrobiia bacterium]MYG94413.1 carbohydrate ABC transporter permease [Acidimicrobiia bacterium]MYI31118.1 carbohydrate ABC transporter permease [Acidimicrobiia bacterium]